MNQTIAALFDGNVLRPTTPLNLEPNTMVELTVVMPDEKATESVSFLDTASSMDLEGPADWSENLDSYLYGKQDD